MGLEISHAERIAVMESEIKGIREQNKAQFLSLQQEMAEMNKAITELVAIMNKGKGAYAASLALAGTIGGFLIWVGGKVAEKLL